MKKQNKIVLTILLIGLIAPAVSVAQTIQGALNKLYAEQYDEAKKDIKTLIKQTPDNDQNYYYAGFIYNYLNQKDSAALYFNHGLKVNDKSALNKVGKGMLALEKGDTVNAQKYFDLATDDAKSRNKTRVYNGIAEALLKAEKSPKKAMELLKTAEEEAYNDEYENIVTANTLVLIGDAYLAMHQAGDAIGRYQDAMIKNPDLKARLYVKIGNIYLSARNSTAALAQFNKAKEADPNYAPAYASLGDIYFHYKIKGHGTDDAKAMYNKYLELSEAKSGIQEKLVKVLYVGKEYDKAITEINKVLTKQPNDIVMNRLLGYSLFKTQKYQEANAAFKKYFNTVTDKNLLVTDYTLYAQSLMQVGNDSLGLKTAFKAIKLDTAKAIPALQEMASAQMDAKKYKNAAALYDKVLAIKDGLSSQDYYSAGRAYIKAEEYSKADSSFAHLIKLSPKNYIGYYMMALTKYYQDPSGEKGYLAKPYYDSVVKITESNPEKYKSILINSYQYIAQYYTSKKDIDTAYSYWKKIDALDPGNENAQKYFEYYKKVLEYRAKKKAAEQAAQSK